MIQHGGPRVKSTPKTNSGERMKRLRRDACRQYGYESGCIVPGCDRPFILHHFVRKSKGGSDAVKNLIPICKFHEDPMHHATRRVAHDRWLELCRKRRLDELERKYAPHFNNDMFK